ncbi:MAG: hypothetical protein J6Q39_04120 [Bacteroidales bacterium]|nr:hypothetical protein [Bacteroidales bacterium]
MANVPIYAWTVTPKDEPQYIYILLKQPGGQCVFRDVFLEGRLDFFYELQRQKYYGLWESVGWCYAKDVHRLLLDENVKIEQEEKEVL